jgi:hypothetical protein
MASNNTAGLLVVGAVVAFALLTWRGIARSAAERDAEDAAGQGGRGQPSPLEGSTTTSQSGPQVGQPVEALGPAGVDVDYSTLWGRTVRQRRPYQVGAYVTAADSAGKTWIVQFIGYDVASRSAKWRTHAGVSRIPWDTDPGAYAWDKGKPYAPQGDPGKTAQSDPAAVRTNIVERINETVLDGAFEYAFGGLITYDDYEQRATAAVASARQWLRGLLP